MKRFIKDLREKDHFQTVFLCREKTSGTDRNGKGFLSITVVDRTGQLNGRMFERAAELAAGFEAGDVVWVKGFVQLYQNRKQIIMHDVRRAAEGEYQMPDLVAELGGDPRALSLIVSSEAGQGGRDAIEDFVSASGGATAMADRALKLR